MVLIAMSIALSSVLRIFWYPSSRFDIWMLVLGLYTLDPARVTFYLRMEATLEDLIKKEGFVIEIPGTSIVAILR